MSTHILLRTGDTKRRTRNCLCLRNRLNFSLRFRPEGRLFSHRIEFGEMTEVASEALISEPFGKKSVQSPLHIRLSQQKRSPVKAQQLLSEMENAVANKQVRCRPFHLAGYALREAGGGIPAARRHNRMSHACRTEGP